VGAFALGLSRSRGSGWPPAVYLLAAFVQELRFCWHLPSCIHVCEGVLCRAPLKVVARW
jgi:hypothetical protein